MGNLFSNIKVKWTRYSTQKLFWSRFFNLPHMSLFTTYHAVMNLLIIHKQQFKIYILHLQAKKNDSFISKNNLIGSSTFCFEIPGDILFPCSQNQYRLPWKQPLNWLIFHLFSLNIFSIFLFNYRVIKSQ